MSHGWRWLELHLFWCFGDGGFEALDTLGLEKES
jgi:hypothetical protein